MLTPEQLARAKAAGEKRRRMRKKQRALFDAGFSPSFAMELLAFLDNNNPSPSIGEDLMSYYLASIAE